MEVAFAIPGDLSTPTGGYAYDRALIAASPGAGLALRHLALPGGFPFPQAGAIAAVADALAGAGAPLLVDGLALGALPVAAIGRAARPLVALCHHPLGLETGLAPDVAAALIAGEAAILAQVNHVIVTSATTGATVTAQLGVPADRITVAPPGLARAPAAPRHGEPPLILSVGSLIRRKGHDLLIAALAGIADRPWTCVIAGAADRGGDWAATLDHQIAGAGLKGRVMLRGALDPAALEALYASADLFCLPSRYEGYGMVFAEAMMRGLPVVALHAGAVPEVVPDTVGILTPPEDVPALARALARLLDDRATAARMSAAARAHALCLPDWDATARTVAAVFRGLS